MSNLLPPQYFSLKYVHFCSNAVARRRPRRLLNILCMFNLLPVSTGKLIILGMSVTVI